VVVPSTVKVTVWVGTTPANWGATVAVMVTGCPNTAVLPVEGERLRLVVAWTTVWVDGLVAVPGWELGARLWGCERQAWASGRTDGVSRARSRVAVPVVGLTSTVRVELFTVKVTVPVGMTVAPVSPVMVAVNITSCP